MTDTPMPTLDLSSEGYQDNVIDVIESTRASCPYAKNDTGYVFLNQKEIKEVFANGDLRFSYYHINAEDSPYLASRVQHMLLAKHGDDHKRLRMLTMRALNDHVVDKLRDDIETIVNDLFDELPETGTVDLLRDFVNPLPARVLGPILGVPYGSVDDLDEWITVSAKSIDAVNAKNDLPAIEDAWRKLEDFLADLLDERRNKLGDDIFSELIKAEENGDSLSRDELTGITSELARAGVETTRAQFGIILYQLLTHPDAWQQLQLDPSLAAYACEEGLRFAPLPHVIPQEATRDLECCGLKLKSGDIAMVHVLAANRDPAAYENPEQFDITRKPTRHFTFGSGAHICPGTRIARMEITIALEALASRLSSCELVETPELSAVSKGSKPSSLRVLIQKSR